MNESRESELIGSIQAAHSILGIMWPKPGVPSLSDSRAFIENRVFESFRSAIKRASEVVALQDGAEFNGCILACNEAAIRLSLNHQLLSDASVDRFVNLLYLATGIAFQKANELGYPKPAWANNHSSVRSIEDLLQACRWTEAAGDVDELLGKLWHAITLATQECGAK